MVQRSDLAVAKPLCLAQDSSEVTAVFSSWTWETGCAGLTSACSLNPTTVTGREAQGYVQNSKGNGERRKSKWDEQATDAVQVCTRVCVCVCTCACSMFSYFLWLDALAFVVGSWGD